ncbi:hypothetical protein F4804DRAFT_336954 [Jackrogersella minutella]|nr:hypothetical protein F4804DRAFT_336954 [Jackrogersella minutella]
MDPGTILSIVQLSLSVFELGSKIAREFLSSNDRVPDKLKRLNDRLGRFHNVVRDIIQESKSHDAPPTLTFPGADAIIETLTECNNFLRQYDSALSTRQKLVAASQRVALAVGPDSTKIEDLDRRIMDHYTELQLWKTVAVEDAVRRLEESMVAMHVSHWTPTLSGSPQLEAPARFAGNDYTMTQATNQPGFPRSPILKATRNTSLPSINEIELPSPRVGTNYSFDVAAQRQRLQNLETGPVMAYLGRSRQDTPISSSSTLFEHASNIGSLPQTLLSTSPPTQFRGPGHSVLLRAGSRTHQFSTTCYRILDNDGSKVVEWSNSGSGVTILHFVPNKYSIPFTVPEDAKFKIFFLPRDIKHQIRVTTAGSQTEYLEDRPEYQFSRKIDRDTFQQNIRAFESLEMIRALRIRSATEKELAMKVHLKVWRQNDHDDKPTFSFAVDEIGHSSYHVEFQIRWFKKAPELKGDNRLILRVYSKENDMEEEPEIHGVRRRSSTFGAKVRKLSGSSSHGSSSRPGSRSRSSSAKAPVPILYEFQGIEPPSDVRNLGYLEIEFKNSELRKAFIKACYEAHRPAMESSRRNSTPSPGLSQQASRPPSLKLGPQQGPHELQDSARYELMGDYGGYELMEDTGVHELMADPGFQIPSPSLTTPYYPEVRFNTETLFAPQRTGDHEHDLGGYKEYDREPRARETG